MGSNFNGRVPGYSFRWAIIGDSTEISTFTSLKNHTRHGIQPFALFSSLIGAFKTPGHGRNDKKGFCTVHSKHGCLFHKNGSHDLIVTQLEYSFGMAILFFFKVEKSILLLQSHKIMYENIVLLLI